MKKVILICAIFLLTGCFKVNDYGVDYSNTGQQDENSEITSWPVSEVIEYTKGTIISMTGVPSQNSYTILVNNTNHDDFLKYVEALKATTYTFVGSNEYLGVTPSKTSSWIGTDGTRYVLLNYYENDSTSYEGHNLKIKIYTKKPEGWS